MEAPILPVERVNTVIYRGEFIRMLQNALRARGYYDRIMRPAIYPPVGGDAPGDYGPETALALREFQRDHPVSTWRDQIYQFIGLQIASCATYNALGLGVHRVFPVAFPGIIDQSLVDTLIAAEQRGLVSFRCYEVPEPPVVVPPEEKKDYTGYILVGLGSAILATVIVLALKR